MAPPRHHHLVLDDPAELEARYRVAGSIAGVADIAPRQDIVVKVARADGEAFDLIARCRIDTYNELEYFRAGGILHYVLRNLAA